MPSATPGARHWRGMARAAHAETTLSRWWSQMFPNRDPEHPSSDAPHAVLDDLLARHREAHRRYHTAAHVEWVLRHIDELSHDVAIGDRHAVLAAAFFHDAIYDPRASQPGANELASAELAGRRLRELAWPEARVRHVHSMIVATATHEVPSDDGPTDPAADAKAGESAEWCDAAVLLDADLAVLGADASGYAAYVNGVRAEYAHVDAESWRTGRAAVLDQFLARASIYATEPGRRRWEARARANLTAERASLRR